MIIPQGTLIIFIVSLLCCCMGFYRFVWFMSVGYGIAAAGIGAAMLIMSLVNGQFSPIFLIICLLFIIYGIRLGGFLLVRELKNVSYQKKLAEVGGNTTVPIFVAVVMWLACAALYLMESAGPIYRLLNGAADRTSAWIYAGAVISVIGIWMEAMADKQKSQQKETHPDMPAMEGLYKISRCPNYFGEILFWTGAFLSGIDIYQGAGQWIMAIAGYIIIVYIMVAGAKRVETRHIKHYGKKPEYLAYADHTPLLIPFVPWYHMTNPDKIAKEEAAKAAKKAK